MESKDCILQRTKRTVVEEEQTKPILKRSKEQHELKELEEATKQKENEKKKKEQELLHQMEALKSQLAAIRSNSSELETITKQP